MRSVTALCFLALASCSSSSNDAAQTDTGTRPSDAAGGDAAQDGIAEDCDPGVDHPAEAVCVHQVHGKVVAQDGTPLKNVVVSICGSVCYFSRTVEGGVFDAHIGGFIVPQRFQVLVHGRPDYASLYLKLPASPADGMIMMPRDAVVPKYDQVGPAMPADGAPGATVTAGDVTLKIPPGTELDLDVEDVANGDAGRLFRSVKWTATTQPDFVADAGVLQLYALAPFAAKTCTKRPCDNTNLVKVAVTIPNATSLPAGTPVEFVTLGTDLYGPPVTIGKLLVAAAGKVSTDGKTISTDEGEGITVLSFVGVRAKK